MSEKPRAGEEIGVVAADTLVSAGRTQNELGTRILSGLVLAAAALMATWWSPWTFTALVLAGVAVLGYEWSSITRRTKLDAGAWAHIAVAMAVTVLSAVDQPIFALIGLLVAGAVVAVLGLGGTGALMAAGYLYVGLPALALVWLRFDRTHGLLAVLFVFLVVWTTDTAAYAAGRLVGGPKLAPKVSPGKTWAGFAGGSLAAVVAAAAFAIASQVGEPVRLAGIGLFLSVLAQVGDLAESALKRRAGVKDASKLIPGHGGLLDRVDGLVLAAFAAAAIGLVLGAAAPGKSLLTGAP
jgi:phosphatidate cytidylyltransferase